MLKDHIKEIREGIKAGLFTNEASVSQGIVLRLLHALSWPTYDTQIVFPEYPLTGRRVDFALCHPPGKPLVFIEVKPLGQSDTGERQLFEYAFHKGVPMAILTDGHEWHFFLPAEQGDYGERRVYKLDIVERDIGEISRRLERYLKYEAVCSGAAIESARADYKDVARERLIRTNLPEAWSKLIQEEDELLLELVAARVESLCGYKPDLHAVASFLKANVFLKIQYHGQMDVLRNFIADRCIIAPLATTTAQELYQAYKVWSGESAERNLLSKRGLGLILGKIGFEKDKVSAGKRIWRGIKLKI